MTSGRYNRVVGLALACPITGKVKNYPGEVPISEHGLSGSVLADQIKSVDWHGRNAKLIGRASPALVEQVAELVGMLLSEE